MKIAMIEVDLMAMEMTEKVGIVRLQDVTKQTMSRKMALE
jgi:hypothetical protein